MVRNRVRKTQKGLHTEENMREAISLVENGMSLRTAADLKHVNYITLFRYVHKKKSQRDGEQQIRLTPNYGVRKVFSNEQEKALEEYIINCSKMSYGLDTLEARRLAYEMAKYHNLNIPPTWEERKMAGIDWLYGYRQRHPDLRLRKPEACSLSRSTSFNKHNVQVFFNNLKAVVQRKNTFGDGTRLFCLDETSTTTVQKPRKVLASKSARQLNKVTSAERGTLVTTCCIVSAIGSALPPAMVFPRKKYKPHMLSNAPPGTLGLAQPTGWMTGELFVEVIKHFIKLTSSTKENPSLLIMDNHESHLAPAVLQIAKDFGVTLLTIPPHCSHKLQPLDVAVFGPFQNFYNSAIDSWLCRHPGQTVTIYEVAELMGQAFEKSMTPMNIKAGFRKTGIFPLDTEIFKDDDFFASEVTNRPLNNDSPSSQTNMLTCSQTPIPVTTSQEPHPIMTIHDNQEPRPSTSYEAAPKPIESQTTSESPIGCRDYPKAGPRKGTNKRKKGKSLILTDTPVKAEIENLAHQRNEKRNKLETTKKEKKKNKTKIEKATKVLFSSSESLDLIFEIEETEEEYDEDGDNLPLFTKKTPLAHDFVLVRFSGKQNKYFVGQILTDKDENNEYDIMYLRKSLKKENSFFFPLEPDLAIVHSADIELVLPKPDSAGKTKRQADIYTFPAKFLKKYTLG